MATAGSGDHLVWTTPTWDRAQPAQRVVLIGHHDTVFPPGTFEVWEQTGDRVRGPGVLDMKGGLATIRTALAALADVGALASLPLALCSVADEETGSSDSRTLLEDLARGAGAAPQEGTHHPVRAVNLKTYKPLVHQHTPEIKETLAAAGAPGLELRFTPVSAPLSRGIFVTIYLELPADQVDDARLAALFDHAYRGEPFVRRPTHRLPEVAAVSGSNYAEVGFTVGEAVAGTRTVVLFSAIDNLIKGGAGQAIQNMNLVLGLDERLSLQDPGGWP